MASILSKVGLITLDNLMSRSLMERASTPSLMETFTMEIGSMERLTAKARNTSRMISVRTVTGQMV